MATGNTLGRFLPAQAELPSSSYPTFDRRNARLVLNFDADAVETCYFGDVLPSNYAGGGLTLDLYWTAATAVAGATVWGVAWEENDPGNNDLDSDTFGTESTATTTTDATSGEVNKTTLTITHANMGSPNAGDPFRLRVRRLATNGSDTMTGNAQFHRAHLKET